MRFKGTLYEQVVTRAPYNIKVTVCHTQRDTMVKSTMTGTVTSSGRGGAAAAMAQNEQTTEEHSTLEQQPRGRIVHPQPNRQNKYNKIIQH